MKFLIFVSIIFICAAENANFRSDFSLSFPVLQAADRECACRKDKIYLDIVAVIDTSNSMTKANLTIVQANLDLIVNGMSLSTEMGYSSRIGIVTIASNATMVAGLNVFNNVDDFEKAIFSLTINQSDPAVNIYSGLDAANNLLNPSHQNPNRQRVVILFTSVYNNGGFNDPAVLAKQMIKDNIKIITVSFTNSMDSQYIGSLAYPSFAFSSKQSDLIEKMFDALCQANCFCAPDWKQYTTNFTDEYARKYGICLYFTGMTSSWISASSSCGEFVEAPGGYLVTEYSQAKHEFNLAYLKSVVLDAPYSNHTGMHVLKNKYVWQTSNPNVTISQQISNYTNWNPGYPNQNIGDYVKVDKVFGELYAWTNEGAYDPNYVLCEVSACDTDNYCP